MMRLYMSYLSERTGRKKGDDQVRKVGCPAGKTGIRDASAPVCNSSLL